VGSRALIVDDELDLLNTLSRLLGRGGYTCRTASSAADAIALIHAEIPDVVVTDLHYLAKPFACRDLVDTVARVCAANPAPESRHGGTR
jgi:ActR/RegA family two-component response regulator